MSLGLQRAHTRERGSALLIVFVFAAIIAIMLYKEMPVVAFEAQRQKEQLLTDRGNEYKHAVKLYVRKFQTFPASIEALETTNRIRFLRHKFVDPFTGKADWRILHAGPGGIIIDSKIKQKNALANGANGSGDNSTTNASTSGTGTSAFGNGGFGSSSDNSTSTNPADAPPSFPQRPPAVSINGGATQNGDLPMPSAAAPEDTAAAQPAGAPGPPVTIPYPGYPGPPTGTTPGQTDSSFPTSQMVGQPMMTGSSGPYPAAGGRGRRNPMTGDSNPPPGQSYPGQGSPGDGGTQAVPFPGQDPNNPTDPRSMMQGFLNNQNPQPTQTGNVVQLPNVSNNAGTTMGGGMAGVASKSSLHTIKIMDDQTNISLWEFVYDMRKELAANAPTLGNNNTGANTGLGGSGIGSPATSFNQQQGNSGFNSPSSNQPANSGFPGPPVTNPQPTSNQ